jgi:hypothetical protein
VSFLNDWQAKHLDNFESKCNPLSPIRTFRDPCSSRESTLRLGTKEEGIIPHERFLPHANRQRDPRLSAKQETS